VFAGRSQQSSDTTLPSRRCDVPFVLASASSGRGTGSSNASTYQSQELANAATAACERGCLPLLLEVIWVARARALPLASACAVLPARFVNHMESKGCLAERVDAVGPRSTVRGSGTTRAPSVTISAQRPRVSDARASVQQVCNTVMGAGDERVRRVA